MRTTRKDRYTKDVRRKYWQQKYGVNAGFYEVYDRVKDWCKKQ